MTDTAAIFDRNRYVILPGLLNEPFSSQAYKYACKLADKNLVDKNDELVPNTPFAYGDFMMDGFLLDLLPRVEEAAGLSLFPTYSFLRVYKQGDTLRQHTDRPSCEISLTLCLGYEGPKSWPIWIQGPHGDSSCALEKGDALLYRGMECMHWREAFEGERQAQVFLHYVDQNGPHSEWRYDKRDIQQVQGSMR